MLRLIEAIFAGKIATEKIDVNGHPRMRGELHCVGSCDGCAKCAVACPVQALAMENGAPVIDYSKCIFAVVVLMPAPRKPCNIRIAINYRRLSVKVLYVSAK